jgi:hypothetical protein
MQVLIVILQRTVVYGAVAWAIYETATHGAIAAGAAVLIGGTIAIVRWLGGVAVIAAFMSRNGRIGLGPLLAAKAIIGRKRRRKGVRS